MFLPGKNRIKTIIFEIGGFTTRIGFGGQDSPVIIQPSEVGYFNDTKQYDFLQFQSVIGSNADTLISPYKNYLYESYLVSNLDIIEQIMINGNKQMRSIPEETHCFIVEQPIQNKELRSKLVEIAFEKINMKGIYFSKSPILSSYIFAKENMLLLESGAYQTYCVPIVEGEIKDKAILKLNLGGETLTQKLNQILQNRQSFNAKYKNFNKLKPDIQKFGQLEVTREIKHQYCKAFEQSIDNLKFNSKVDNTLYQLPDHRVIEISEEVYTVPEMMFQEDDELNLKGFPELIYEVITKIDPEYRREQIQNIVFLGGNSLTPGSIDRLQKEIFELQLNGLEAKAKVFSATGYQDQQHSAWIGASIMASMTTFDQMVMTKNDYLEHGLLLIERKCVN